MADDKILLDEREAAALLGMSVVFMQRDRCRGGAGIPFVKVGKRSVKYRRADLEMWCAQHLRTPEQRETRAAPPDPALPPRRRGRPTKAEQLARAAAILELKKEGVSDEQR